MNSIKSDDISEKYRKYVIALQLDDRLVYSLWGTDLVDDVDKLLIDNAGGILTFTSISSLIKNVMLYASTFSDKMNVEEWSRNYSNDEPYISYNLKRVKTLLNSEFNLISMNEDDAKYTMDFYNLATDYIHQLGRQDWLKLIRTKNLEIFFDFVYNNFFWNNVGRRQQILADSIDFKVDTFQNDFLKIVLLFEKSLVEV